MLKKVFLIVISSFILYGCGSMKHATIVLYVSHDIEGPLYIPTPEPPKLANLTNTTEGTTNSLVGLANVTEEQVQVYEDGYKTRITDRGEILILDKPIRFAFEKYGIGSYYNDSIEYVAKYMKEYTNVRLIVEGHTDRIGKYAYNKTLSLRRSRTALNKLTRAGISKDRLIESGLSYRFREYSLHRLNRRVEFVIIKSEEDLTNYRVKVK